MSLLVLTAFMHSIELAACANSWCTHYLANSNGQEIVNRFVEIIL